MIVASSERGCWRGAVGGGLHSATREWGGGFQAAPREVARGGEGRVIEPPSSLVEPPVQPVRFLSNLFLG